PGAPLNRDGLDPPRPAGWETPPERVVRRDALGELEEPPEERFLLPAEGLEFDEVVAPAQDAAEPDDQHIDQRVAQVLALPPWVGDRRQRCHQGRLVLGLHLPPSLIPGPGSVCTDPAEHDQRKSLSGNHLRCARPGTTGRSPRWRGATRQTANAVSCPCASIVALPLSLSRAAGLPACPTPRTTSPT